MAKTREAVKIVTHGDPGEKKLTALAGLVVGAIAGAGGVKAAIDRRGHEGEIDIRTDEEKHHDKAKQDKSKGQRAVGPFDRDAVGLDESKDEKKPKGKLVAFAEKRNWRWLGRTLQVLRRYSELRGNNLANAVTLQVFLSLFPMLLVASAVIGFVMSNNEDVTGRIISAMGLTGAAADTMTEALQTAQDKRGAASILGFSTLVWSALGVSAALQYAYDQTWQVGGRGLKDKAVGVAWLAGASLLFVASAAISVLLNWLPASISIFGTVLAFVLSAALWLFTSKVLPNVDVPWKALIPGAILGAIGLEILKILGAVWVPRAVESSSSLYGTIGIVFAVLAWLLLFGKLVVYSSVLNVVLYEGKHGVSQQTIDMPKPAVRESSGVTRSGQGDTQ